MSVGSAWPSEPGLANDRPRLPWASRLACHLTGFASGFFIVLVLAVVGMQRLGRFTSDLLWLILPILCLAALAGACFGTFLCRWRDFYFTSHPERSAIPGDILFVVVIACWGITLYSVFAPISVSSRRDDMDVALALHGPSDQHPRSSDWGVGTLIAYRSPPEGMTGDWAPCDGRTLPASDHPALARLLLEGKDPANPPAILQLPDYRGMFESGSPPWVPESRPEDDSPRPPWSIPRLHLRPEIRSPASASSPLPVAWYLKVR